MAYIAFTAFLEPPKFAHCVAPAETPAEAMQLANWDMGYNWPLVVAECSDELAKYARTDYCVEIAFFDGVAMTAAEAAIAADRAATEAKRVAA